MTRETRTKKLTYKKAVFRSGDPKLELESAILGALNGRSLARERLYHPIPDGPDVRLINHPVTVKGLFCGDYLSYESGRAQLLVRKDGAAKFWSIGQLASSDVRRDSEFLDSTMLWGLAGNHLVLIQSAALRATDFERYLNWLLGEAGILDGSDSVALEDRPSTGLRRNLAKAQVNEIKMSLPFVHASSTNRPDGAKRLTVTEAIGAEALAAIIGPQRLRELNLGGAAHANLKAEVRITYSRSTDESGLKVLNQLGAIIGKLDTVDADDVEFNLDGVGRIRGSELRLEKAVSLPSTNGVVNPTDAFVEMGEWLSVMVQNGLLEV